MVTTKRGIPLQIRCRSSGVSFLSLSIGAVEEWGRSYASAAADIGHFGCHDGHELDVGFQWKRDNWISARRLYDAKCGRCQGLKSWSDIDEYTICQHRIV
jgi:hypothetical protein